MYGEMAYLVELAILFGSLFVTYRLLTRWYPMVFAGRAFVSGYPDRRNGLDTALLASLPLIAFAMILYTLLHYASFDVMGDFIYIVLYMVLGYAWLYFGLYLMAYFWDLSWMDDAMTLGNKAAVYAVAGGFLATLLIYAGANIGDGPGWWCVVVAAGLGQGAMVLLGLVMDRITGVFERITVERDKGCGIRFGLYLLACGIILGRASAGDWTSLAMTVIEFLVGWPALLLTGVAVLVENHYRAQAELAGDFGEPGQNMAGSMVWGLLYVAIAVASVLLLPPLPVNPMYGA